MLLYNKKLNNLFYYWLLISFFLVFLIVLVGGLTRLTDSGLSITQWELFKGILPPLNESTWYKYFSLYKEIPQFKLIYSNMTLSEFKIIFYWEYFHRMLGRILGLFFLIPFIFFYFSGNIPKKYLPVCLTILLLIFLQGTIGWYMVKSGLVNNISVSHYRLSLHLTVAFIIISTIFWTLLNLKKNTFKSFFSFKNKNNYFLFLIFLIFFQIIMGAFVSGLDAGRIYQSWPLMNYSYFPDDVIINRLNDLLSFGNHGLIQFYHRNIAYFILIYTLIFGLVIYKKKLNKIKIPYYYVLLIIFLQVILGILTLISSLNIYLASAHQICSLLLVLSVINLYYNYIN